MGQLDVFLSNQDIKHVFEYIVSSGGQLIPDIHYNSPAYIQLQDVDRCMEYKKQKPSFFIVHNEFVKIPLEMRQLKSNDDDQKYYIMPRNGGPAIQFLCHGEYFKNDLIYIAPAMLLYYPTFWNYGKEENEPVSEEHKNYYRNIVRFIQTSAVKTSPGGFWVGKDAVKQAYLRAKLIGSTGVEYHLENEAEYGKTVSG